MGWVTSGNPLPYLSGQSWRWSWDGRIFFGAWRLCWSFGESHSFSLLAIHQKRCGPPGLGAMLQILSRERLSWVLSLFYFLTFGGFVAFSIYLPVLLKDQFGLKPADAGFRTAGFVVLATLARPLGGWLSDKIGGARVLQTVFLGIIPFALLMSWPAMLPFTVGALGCAFLLGIETGRSSSWCRSIFQQKWGRLPAWWGPWVGSEDSFHLYYWVFFGITCTPFGRVSRCWLFDPASTCVGPLWRRRDRELALPAPRENR